MDKLTPKMLAVVETVVNDVAEGRGLNPVDATEKIYNVSNRQNARVISSRNMGRDNFRKALIEGLTKRKIVGKDSRVEEVLDAGLYAEDKNGPDHKTRLEFVKEINKVTGVYAPEKKQRMNLNIDMSKEELDERIKSLNQELNE